MGPRSNSGASRFADLDSAALLDLVRAGDNDAFGELFVRYESFARRVARRASRRHADDLVGEAFRRVLTAISRGAGPTQAFGPYLATTIRSAAAGLAAPFQEVELDVSAELLDDSGEVDPRVATAYTSLPEAWQNALWYADVEGLSPRHAAPLLGLPSANAFSALRQRARAALRASYLTLVVEDACNDEVRAQLQALIDGNTSADAVNQLVDDHVAECDTCAAIAWRVGAVTGRNMAVTLAPAILLLQGFSISSAILPAGLGATGLSALWGFWRYTSNPAVTAAASAAAVSTVVVGSVLGAAQLVGNDEPPPPTDQVAVAEPAPSSTAPAVVVEPTPTTTPVTIPTTTAPATSTTPPPTTVAAPPSATPPPTTVAITAPPAPPTTVRRPSPPVTARPTTTPPPPAPPSTTTTLPPTTTTTTTTIPPTTTTTTTTSTTTTTTTTTTTIPENPGTIVITNNEIVNGERVVAFDVRELSGAAGHVTFSREVKIESVSRAVCAGARCDFVGVAAPDAVGVDLRTDLDPLLITLFDSDGNEVMSVLIL